MPKKKEEEKGKRFEKAGLVSSADLEKKKENTKKEKPKD